MSPPDARPHEPLFAYLRRDFTPLRATQTVGEALEFLRLQQLGERLIYFYVTDENGKLVGVIPTRRLLMTETTEPVSSIMVRRVITLPSWATVREACEAFLRHRYLAFPVVDAEGHLHGVADVGLFTGEIADLAERQAVDDIFQLIGVHVAEAVTPWRSFRDRLPWLSFNVWGGLLAAALIGFYEALLSAAVVLALFIPVVLALAESVSMQSVTLTLQRLHGSRVTRQRFFASLRRELLTALLLGGACGVAVGLIAWLWKGSGGVALAIASAIWLSVLTACTLGVALPMALRAVRRDPRIAAGPVVLATADLLTLLFYFNLAGWLLR
jgi:magnesium transporter